MPKRVLAFDSYEMRATLGDKRLELLGSGSSRMTFASPCGRFVYKVPRNGWGEEDNRLEAEISKQWLRKTGHDGRRPARCKMIPGTNILVMERLNLPFEKMDYLRGVPEKDDPRPPWTKLLTDGRTQVGLTKGGQWAVYDYGWDTDAPLFAAIYLGMPPDQQIRAA